MATSMPPYMRSLVCSPTGSPHWRKYHQILMCMCTAQLHFACVLCTLKHRRILLTPSIRSYTRWYKVQLFERKRGFKLHDPLRLRPHLATQAPFSASFKLVGNGSGITFIPRPPQNSSFPLACSATLVSLSTALTRRRIQSILLSAVTSSITCISTPTRPS
jgi:hypothetical protein